MAFGIRTRLTVLIGLAGTVGLVFGILLYQTSGFKASAKPDIPGFLWPNPKPLAAFELVDQNRQAFDLNRLRDKWTFLFFGYTHCPDVCPLALTTLTQVGKLLNQSEERPEAIQFAFVSVDPSRDTPEHLAQYLGYFQADFVGASGPDAKLSELTRQLGILYVRNEPDANGGYLVDHTASILLTDPAGRLVAVFSAPHDATVIAERFIKIQRFVARQTAAG